MLTARQLAMRREAIGGSEIAVLAGLSRWCSPIEIFNSKVFGVEKEQTDPMLFGSEFEAPICNIYARKTSRRILSCDSVKNPRFPYALATPDRAVFLTPEAESEAMLKHWREPEGLQLEGIQLADRALEAKSTTWRLASEWGTPGSDEIPPRFLVQCQWTLGVTTLKLEDLAVLFDRDRYEHFSITFDAEFFEALYEIGARFMVDHVLTKKPPPPDASHQYGDFLVRHFPREQAERPKKGKKWDLPVATSAQDEMVLRYAALKQAEKILAGWISKARHEICAEIEHGAGFFSERFGRVTWLANKPTQKLDRKAYADDLERALSDAMGAENAAFSKKIIDDLRAKNTKAGAPVRQLRGAWAGEAKEAPALRVGALELAALPAAEGQAPEVDDEEQS